ncbi:MAG TPA: DUF3160 domain-containing protein, partial [Gemmataceae bacterium]|nr:DUF3160 domain-containing protein [Gemmataceae bacterium]
MARIPRTLLVGAVAVSLTGAVMGQTPDTAKPVEPSRAVRWEDMAKARGLDETDIQLLRQHKFVIAGKPLKQVFQPYLSSDVPVFITPDSLLNGFHVLFEESIYRMEQAHARKLPGILERLWKDLDRSGKQFKGDPRLLYAARKRAQVFLGTARQLLDAKALPEDAAWRKLVEQEAQRVIAAREKLKPAWLGLPDGGFRAVDYSRFQPRGFYTKSPALQRYFRAVSWLQAIPFRLDNDEELASFLLLSRAFRGADEKRNPEGAEFWGAFRTFVGTEDDWDLPSASVLPKEITKEGLNEVRKKYRDRAGIDGAPQINDQLRFEPDHSGGKLEIGFRFLSAYRLPDGVLFHRTMKPELGERVLPTGLEVCAILGSS